MIYDIDKYHTEMGVWKYLPELRNLARINRKIPTSAEKKMWTQFLSKRVNGYKFLRQKPIGRFIVDFYCPKLLFVIELDGPVHHKRKYNDLERDIVLGNLGIYILRFSNNMIENKFEMVKEKVSGLIERRKVNFPPPFLREG